MNQSFEQVASYAVSKEHSSSQLSETLRIVPVIMADDDAPLFDVGYVLEQVRTEPCESPPSARGKQGLKLIRNLARPG